MCQEFLSSWKPQKPTHTGNLFLSLLSTLFVVSGAFAIDPDIPVGTTSGDCEDGTLNIDSGSANLEINWAPNEIALHWYSDGEELNNIPTESQTCIYDGTLTPPSTIPTKTGYTFKGWRVKQAAQCSFTASEVDGMSGVDYGYTRLNGGAGSKEAQYGLTTPGEWATEFNTGIIKGMAKCSNTRGSYATPGTPSDTNGKYCWCRATNYTPNGGNQCNVSSSSWVYNIVGDLAVDCANGCAYACAYHVLSEGGFRRPVFGGGQ